MVAIVDYGMGNLASVKKALDFLNVRSEITSNSISISKSEVILLPGVGSFQQGMLNLKEKGLIEILSEQVLVKKKPFIGICLGMQLIMSRGNEPVPCEGLGWIDGSVEKIQISNYRIPHMGWNSIVVKDESYLKDLNGKDFYFIHSYHVIPKDNNDVAAYVNYGKDIVACVRRENMFATQFHPEKSQQVGLNLLKQFFDFNVKG